MYNNAIILYLLLLMSTKVSCRDWVQMLI